MATTVTISRKRPFNQLSESDDQLDIDRFKSQHKHKPLITDKVALAAVTMRAIKKPVHELFVKQLRTIPQHVVLHLLEWVQQTLDFSYNIIGFDEEAEIDNYKCLFDKIVTGVIGRFKGDSTRKPVLIFRSLRFAVYDILTVNMRSKFFDFVSRRVRYLEFEDSDRLKQWCSNIEYRRLPWTAIQLRYIDVVCDMKKRRKEKMVLHGVEQHVRDKIRSYVVNFGSGTSLATYLDANVDSIATLDMPNLRTCSSSVFQYLDVATMQHIRRLVILDDYWSYNNNGNVLAALQKQPNNITELGEPTWTNSANLSALDDILKQLPKLKSCVGSDKAAIGNTVDILPVDIKCLPVLDISGYGDHAIQVEQLQRFGNIDYLCVVNMYAGQDDLRIIQKICDHVIARNITLSLTILPEVFTACDELVECIARLNKAKLLDIFVLYDMKLTAEQIKAAAFEQGVIRQAFVNIDGLSVEDVLPLLTCSTVTTFGHNVCDGDVDNNKWKVDIIAECFQHLDVYYMQE